ncbi:MAG: hypothetical protein FWE39_12640 [Nocardiaceae bacterium]|nr:hypothetical protein [Nocardiaceae bacterium]
MRGDARGGVEPTAILDWGEPGFDHLDVPHPDDASPSIEFLRGVHRLVQRTVRPVYALDDTQPASVTLARTRGSCSQRLAVVEAIARRNGIATRVEGLVLRGEFWYPRFRYLRRVVPDRVLLAWPSFFVDGEWIDASHAFTAGCDLNPEEFANSGEETLFDAAARSRISWGTAASAGCLDLSEFVIQSLGTFDSRDDLFGVYGQTLPRAVRGAVEPVFSRWGAR